MKETKTGSNSTLQVIEDTIEALKAPLPEASEPDTLFRRVIEVDGKVKITLERILSN